MTEGKARISERDKKTAQQWVSLMLDEPSHHAQGFANWIARNPTRRAYSLDLLRAMQRVTPAAAARSLPRASRWAGYYGLINKTPVLIAASMLAAVGLLLSVTTELRSLGSSSLITSATARTMIRTKVGEVRTERLADGTTVILDTDTLATVEIGPQQRGIELQRGRIRVVVARNDVRPFTVKAGTLRIATMGTTFDVSYRAGLKIQPIEGVLEVDVPASVGEPAARTLSLRPGEMLALEAGPTTAPAVIPARRSEQQWVDGVKSFENVPIREIIAEANSYSDTKLQLEDPKLGDRVLFADLNIRDIEMVAEAIARYLHLDIDRSQAKRLILRPHR
jgi:transmembrane sensor